MLIRGNGDHFEGEWKHDQIQGFGISRSANRDYYEGMWKDDVRHG